MNRYAYTIFCDDIRNEINGKSSLIGVVGSLLYVNTFPCVLPKLCVIVTVSTEKDQPFKSLTFNVMVGDEPVFDMAMGESELEQIFQDKGLIEDPKGVSAQAVVVLSPLNLKEPCKIKAFVVADGERIDCPSLQISKAPEGTLLL